MYNKYGDSLVRGQNDGRYLQRAGHQSGPENIEELMGENPDQTGLGERHSFASGFAKSTVQPSRKTAEQSAWFPQYSSQSTIPGCLPLRRGQLPGCPVH